MLRLELGSDEIQNELSPAMVTIYGRKDQLRCNAAAAFGREVTLKFIEFKADDATPAKSSKKTGVETRRNRTTKQRRRENAKKHSALANLVRLIDVSEYFFKKAADNFGASNVDMTLNASLMD